MYTVGEYDEETIGYENVSTVYSPKIEIPSKSEDEVKEFFIQVAGNDREVDSAELQQVLSFTFDKDFNLDQGDSNAVAGNFRETFINFLLNLICGAQCKDSPVVDAITSSIHSETKSRGFPREVCRSMIAMLDEDRSGKLGYPEFTNLWTLIKGWRDIFYTYDADQSGTFSGFELKEALASAGYHLNKHVLCVLMHRYGNKKGEMYFEDFIMCVVRLKSMMEIYRRKAGLDENQSVSFTMEEWVENTLYS